MSLDPLFDTYLSQREPLRRFLVARTGSAEEAEDLIQELYLRLRQDRPGTAVENPIAYLYKMALNLARDRRRSRLRTQARDGQWIETVNVVLGAETIMDIAEPEAALDAKARLKVFLSALSDLPDQCRKVFQLHKIDGLSHSEVALELGISRSTVEKHMSLALRRLSAHMSEWR